MLRPTLLTQGISSGICRRAVVPFLMPPSDSCWHCLLLCLDVDLVAFGSHPYLEVYKSTVGGMQKAFKHVPILNTGFYSNLIQVLLRSQVCLYACPNIARPSIDQEYLHDFKVRNPQVHTLAVIFLNTFQSHPQPLLSALPKSLPNFMVLTSIIHSNLSSSSTLPTSSLATLPPIVFSSVFSPTSPTK